MRRSPRTPIRPTLRQRLEFRAARMMFGLPAAVQVRLSGRARVTIQGATLHPQMQLMLALHAALRPALPDERVAIEARAALRREALGIAGSPIAVGAVTDLAIEGSGGMIGVRHYAPAAGKPRPLLVYFHGGGFVAGDIDTHDTLCRRICRDADLHVLSVDYRLAPEHPFPAAVEDAVAAFRWALANAPVLGALPDKVAVGGDSAGGNLAAVICQQAAADGGPAPCAQILLYPPTDRTRTWESLELLADGFFLRRADIDWYHQQYTGSAVAQPNPAQNPLVRDEFLRPGAGAHRHRRLRSAARRRRSLCRCVAAGGRAGRAEALRWIAARLRQHGDDQPGLRRRRRRDHCGAAHVDRRDGSRFACARTRVIARSTPRRRQI